MDRKDDGNNRSAKCFWSRTGIITTGLLVFCAMTAFANERPAGGAERAALVSGNEPLIGAYYYPWYSAEGRHWNDGYLRGSLVPPQAPLLGEYDSRDETVINQHIQWAKEAGVDFFCVSYWGKDTFGDQSVKNNFARSKGIEDFKFAILYETISANLLESYNVKGTLTFEQGNEAEKIFLASVDYLADTYFSHPSYLRIDGKPVLVFYLSHNFSSDYKGTIDKLRSMILEKHGFELYLVGDEVDPHRPPNADRIACFDAITPYIQYWSPNKPVDEARLRYADDAWLLQNARMKNSAFKAIADRLGVGFIPNALPCFNDRGVRLDVDHYALPYRRNPQDPRPYSLFEDSLQMAGEFMNPDRKMLLVTSWNEWHEDTQIEPVTGEATAEPFSYTLGLKVEPYGFDLLQVLKKFKTSYSGPQPLPAMKKLKITEVCLAYDGQGGASYIELFNPGEAAMDLEGMRLCLRSKHDSYELDHFYVRLQGIVPAGEYYLIATPSGRDQLKEHDQVQVDLTLERPEFSQISADNGQMAVRDYHGRIVDAFSWTVGSSFDGDYVEKENLKLHASPVPNQAMIRRDHDRDQDNSALDFEVGVRSPRE